MAEQSAADRTEKPTPERLRKARQEGQVPQSVEMPSALMVGVLLLVLALVAPSLMEWFVTLTEEGFSFRLDGSLDGTTFSSVLKSKGREALVQMAPFLIGAGAVSVLGSLLVSGWAFSPKALRWDLGRLSLVSGLRNMFSVRSVVALVISLAKLAVILVIVWSYLHDKLDDCLRLRWASPEGLLCGIGRLTFGVMARIAIGLLVIGGIDMVYQKWHYRRQMRMTRQEVKEELRQHELAPELRGRIRAVQIEMFRRRMLQAVPKADVVLTNPTHVAVALKYDAATMAAPVVVAKGPDLLAEKIKEIARAHGVAVIERPELARAIYGSVEVGQTVPEVLFVAVAEVLAMIYRLRRGR
jgi:flagellar biosynthetic protein FlhB